MCPEHNDLLAEFPYLGPPPQLLTADLWCAGRVETLRPCNWNGRQMNEQQTLRLVQEFCAVFKPRDGTARADYLDGLIPGPSPVTVGCLYGLGLRLSHKASLGLYLERQVRLRGQHHRRRRCRPHLRNWLLRWRLWNSWFSFVDERREPRTL